MTKRGFQPGESGNPQGKPPGPNKLTRAMRQRIAEECDPIGFLSSVMRGQPQAYGEGEEASTHIPTMDQRMNAARVLANKQAPDAKDRPLSFDVGPIKGPDDALAAMARVVEAMSAGDLTASEAGGVMTVVGHYLSAWETTDVERRLRALEGATQ